MVPHNGSREDHVLADGSPAGYQIFYAVIGGVFGVMMFMWLLIWGIFKTSKRQFKKKGLPTDH